MQTKTMTFCVRRSRMAQWAASAFLSLAATLSFADRTWTGTNGWWSDASKWTPKAFPARAKP